VLHLISSWRDALREFRRLLAPGGAYLNVSTWETTGVSPRDRMRRHWRGWLEAQGVDAYLPGARSREELVQELVSMGARVAEVEVVRYARSYTLREELERFEARICSDAWEIPEAVFEASIRELRSWVTEEFGDLDGPHQDTLRFAIDVARFDR
jgi:hypothetical protein